MVVNFAGIDLGKRPTLILKNAGGTPLGVLGYAKGVDADIKYNETSTLEFSVPAQADGQDVPLYDEITGMRIVELEGVGQFTLINPTDETDGIKRSKTCKAYSLEYEFAYKKISIAEGTYRFWDITQPGNTVLGMIMELMPSWSVGDVSTAVANKYRTFEVSNENVYNFMKGTLQETYNCIFDFDTMTRTVSVRSCDAAPLQKPVFISNANLAKEISLEEQTEDIVTRLDVNGADGVDIRDVNPCGTNRIINLSYYMTPANFDQALITKYNAWAALRDQSRESFYNLSVQYAIKIMQLATEQAKLADLEGELKSCENVQGVAAQAVAQGIGTQAALDAANAAIAAKNAEIAAKRAEISVIEAAKESVMANIAAIKAACAYETYFTEAELLAMDRYIKDGEISDNTFVMAEAGTYTEEGKGMTADGKTVSVSGAEVQTLAGPGGSVIYDIRGGDIASGMGNLSAKIVSAAVEIQTDDTFVMSAYLNEGEIGGAPFPSACLSVTGTLSTHTADSAALSLSVSEGYGYFTQDASEYERRSVAWDLYEYGEQTLVKLAQPSYTFDLSSANFLTLEEFEAFKNAIALGEKIYIQLGDGRVLEPIFVGAHIDFDNLASLDLTFGDSFTASDSTFRLVDLLDKSVSMGKNVSLSKYMYASFVDSGASAGIHDFMESALDVAKNEVMSSGEQAISWDGSGIRLRRWTSAEHTGYADEQMWIINNSIILTDDGWETAKMAIGAFHDTNLGDVWGIIAPNIVGTLLAGEELVIESTKQDGGQSVFRVDGEGVRLYNGDISVVGGESTDPVRTQIVLNPELGFVIGRYPTYTTDPITGEKSIDTTNAMFWADTSGNLVLAGGAKIGGQNGWTLGSGSMYSGQASSLDAQGGIYLGTDGISVTQGAAHFTTSDFKVYISDSGQELVMDTEGVYMTSLTVDNLTVSSNAISTNIAGVYNGPSVIHVDPRYDSSEGRCSSLQAAFDMLSHMRIDSNVVIEVEFTLYENARLEGPYGNGSITIYPIADYALYGSVDLWRCNLPVYYGDGNNQGLSIVASQRIGLDIRSCSFVWVRNCGVIGYNANDSSSIAIQISNGSNVILTDVDMTNAYNLLRVVNLSTIYCRNLRGGRDGNPGCTNFLYAFAAVVMWDGTRPHGALLVDGASVLSPDATSLANHTIASGMSVPADRPQTETVTVSAGLTGSYDAVKGWYGIDVMKMTQGIWDGAKNVGCMWFPTSAFYGKTITSASLKIRRADTLNGRGSAVDVKVQVTAARGRQGSNPIGSAIGSPAYIGTALRGDIITGNGSDLTSLIQTIANSSSVDPYGLMLVTTDTAMMDGRRYSENYAVFEGMDGYTPELTVSYY